MAEEEVVVVVAATAPVDVSPVSSDHKRKLEDLEPHEEEEAALVEPVASQAEAHVDSNEEAKEIENSVPDAKRPRLEEEEESESVPAVENGHQLQKVDVLQEDNPEIPTEEKTEIPTEEKTEIPAEEKAEPPAEEKADQPSEHNHQGEGAQDTSMENLETENVDKSSIENPEMENQEPSIENPQTEDAQHSPGGKSRQTADGILEQGDLSSGQQHSLSEDEGQSMTRKMEVPNNKVGVLIGKAGDTIRFLQYNSGAKIQITRDVEADRYASTRPVELIGSLENINKAEKLIKDVIAEADAGGSPSLVARGFGTVQASGAAEQIQIQVPNEKVGLIIGKGGETIKNLQTRSGARIQLIPQHLPEGDQSKERIVRVSGDKKQIEVAREMIKEVMNQPVRQSPLSGGYNQQQNYRPRGPTGPNQWGPRGSQTAQGSGYDYPQRGMYPSQNPQYMPPSYGGYPPQQSGLRGNFHAGWDQRSSGHSQGPSSQATGYDYYGQGGGHMSDGPAPGPVSNAAAPHGSGSAIGAPSSQVNYNYGQAQGMDYGHPNTYSQNAHPQQSYGHGYEDPKYPNQGPAQPGYGGHGNSQAGAYPQQGTQPGYGQQPYGNKPPAYNMPSQGPPQTYGMPRASQPGEMPYQGPNPSNPSYGSTMPGQQGYPYASGGPTQQTYPYGPAPVANDGYGNQAPPHSGAPGYLQQGPQSGYGQPGVQPAPGYAQGGAQGGYGPYPSQPGYGEQQAGANNVAYGGYQGHADPGYNSGAPTAAYGAPPSGQAGYVQPAPNQPGYEQQPMPQGGGYGNVPAGAAPGGYAKNVSPQPAGYNQYDATTQMYGGHH